MANDSINQSSINIETGLTASEAQRRLGEYGPNEVPEKKNNPLIQFAKKFWGLTPWMLEFTVALEWVLGKYTEAYVIVILLIFNAVVSYIQEEKANNAVELLRKRLTVMARVKRDGAWAHLPAREIVPGDVIRLRAGDMDPADAKIVDGQVEVDQSARAVRGLANVGVYSLLSVLCLVLNREAAENVGRLDKALSPTFFNVRARAPSTA